MSDTIVQGVWGFCGAFIYAAPRVSACLFSASEREASRWGCLLEFAIALIIGAIGAAAFAPWVAGWRGTTLDRDMNAICAMIGLLANPIAPIIVNNGPAMLSNIVSGRFLKALKGNDP